MRLAFFLLVLANLVFFVWAQGYLGGQEDGREPQRLAEQVEPHKMKLALAPAVAVAEAEAVPPHGCRRVDGLAVADAERFQQELSGAGLAVSVQGTDPTPSYWVNIPALPNQAAADKKAAELKALGVADFHVMQANGGFVVSLGLFRDAAAANDFLAALGQRGVRSARVDTQTRPAMRLEVRGGADVLATRLPALLAAAGATAADCP